jgi:altronate hydrolase
MPKQIILLDHVDNVAVAPYDLDAGENLEAGYYYLVTTEKIKAKHKVALKDFKIGDEIKMYGVVVGKAKEAIKVGQAITTKNVAHATQPINEVKRNFEEWEAPNVEKWQGANFKGYHRNDGKVGTANHWLVMPLVFCENKNIELIKDAVEYTLDLNNNQKYRSKARSLFSQGNGVESEIQDLGIKKYYPNVDGIKFLTHQMGCGGTRQDATMLVRLLAGYIANPNTAGATLLSLGCQNAQKSLMLDTLKKLYPSCDKPIDIIEQQEEGNTEALIEKSIVSIKNGLEYANKFTRKPSSLDKLVIGLECGGSDGLSGITANPTLGGVSDKIVALGGSAILAEFPELCGVEQEIIDRCTEDDAAYKFIDLMRTYEKSAVAAGSGFDMNPSPGNIRDGLITDAMKSAGAAKKGGTSPIVDVLDYTDPVIKNGFQLLCTPGNDVESTTAEAASGANIILFTTGLGTPTGNPITPVLKVSSNDALTARMPDIIDYNAGSIISESKSLDQASDELLDLIIATASGEYTAKADLLGQDDFIPWKRGVSL